jgi:hypothetical protein
MFVGSSDSLASIWAKHSVSAGHGMQRHSLSRHVCTQACTPSDSKCASCHGDAGGRWGRSNAASGGGVRTGVEETRIEIIVGQVNGAQGLQVGCKALVQPQLVPVLHGHQVPKPLV